VPTQYVEIFDAATGVRLNEQAVTDYAAGKYVTYDLTGNVLIRVSNRTGDGATLSGLFVDEVPAAGTSVVAVEDRTTGGNWRSKFSTDGAVIIGRTNFPAGVGATITGGDTEIVAGSTTKKGALLLPGETRRGSVGYLRAPTAATVALDFADDLVSHQVSIYALDFEKQKRVERVDLLDVNGDLLDRRTIGDFSKGLYLTWNVVGDVSIRVTRVSGPDAVLSAVFVDESLGLTGHFVGQDATTGGSWHGKYGLDAQYVAGEGEVNSLGVVSTLDDADLRVISRSTTVAAALQKISAQDRIAAFVETRSTMTLTLSLGSSPRRVAFYAADLDNKKRTQTIEIFDADGNLISGSEMVAFKKGVYATFDLTGDVTVVVTNTAGNDNRAVLNGVFFD
jgi:hypothetical protein